MILGSASNYQIINILIFKDLVFTHVHEFLKKNYIASMTSLLKFSENYLNVNL
jgi:hypothetical protein